MSIHTSTYVLAHTYNHNKITLRTYIKLDQILTNTWYLSGILITSQNKSSPSFSTINFVAYFPFENTINHAFELNQRYQNAFIFKALTRRWGNNLHICFMTTDCLWSSSEVIAICSNENVVSIISAA